jgi:hypothetical protein
MDNTTLHLLQPSNKLPPAYLNRKKLERSERLKEIVSLNRDVLFFWVAFERLSKFITSMIT